MIFTYENGVAFNLSDEKYEIGVGDGLFDSGCKIIKLKNFDELEDAFVLRFECFPDAVDPLSYFVSDKSFDYILHKFYSTDPKALIQFKVSRLEFYLPVSESLALYISVNSYFDLEKYVPALYDIWSGIEINNRRVSCNGVTPESLVELYQEANKLHEEKKAKEIIENHARAKERKPAQIKKYNKEISFDLQAGSDLIKHPMSKGPDKYVIANYSISKDGSENYMYSILIDELENKKSKKKQVNDLAFILQQTADYSSLTLCDSPLIVLTMESSMTVRNSEEVPLVCLYANVCYKPGRFLQLRACGLAGTIEDIDAVCKDIENALHMILIAGEPLALPTFDYNQLRKFIREGIASNKG